MRKLYLFVTLILILQIATPEGAGPSKVQANTGGLNIPGTVEGTGTHFAITDSDYLNITLDSTEPIDVILSSVPQIVLMHLESTFGATSTQITLSGFLPQTTYYIYEDNHHTAVAFTTDASGSYTYIQGISQKHLVLFQTATSTYFISDDATGGDCSSIGTWDIATKTCTMTADVTEMIEIDSDNVTLDGNGFSISGPTLDSGVFLFDKSGVTIRNLTVSNTAFGIISFQSSNSTFTGNNLSGNGAGIFNLDAFGNIVANNTISNTVFAGIYMALSLGDNEITGNNVSNSAIFGILYLDSQVDSAPELTGDVIAYNTISNNGAGIALFRSIDSQIYNNNFIANIVQVDSFNGTGNVFDHPVPIGGNYWDNFDTPSEGCNDADSNGFCDTPFVFPDNQDNLPWTTQDGWAASPSGQAPVVDAGGPYLVDEGGSVILTASGSDPDGAPLAYAFDLDNDGSFETPGQSATFSALGLDGPSMQTIAVQVTDTDGLSASDIAIVTINNVAPTIEEFTGLSADPMPVDTSVIAGATFTDPGTPDTHTAVFDWGDGYTSAGTVDQINYTVSANHTYASAGVYAVTLTVTDDDGGSDVSVFQFVVVYDADGGFVTGGGWFDSPPGAYTPEDDSDPDIVGNANFGFVSKYKKGQSVPTGQTQFNFTAGDLNFHSGSYEWLVVAGHKAMYKGVGTINGTGNYGFMITAIDEKLTPSTDVDLFRMRIWDKDNSDTVIYDNQVDGEDDADPTTAIGGGNIVIHKKK